MGVYWEWQDDKSETASTTSSKPSSNGSVASSFISIPTDQLPSVELRAGVFYPRCLCSKRNGLQDQCPRTGCGLPECILVPPKCIPGGGPGPDPTVVAPENGTAAEDAGNSGTADNELRDINDLGNIGYLCCNPKCPVLERSRKAAKKAAKEVPRKQAFELPEKPNMKMEHLTTHKLSYGPPFGEIKQSRRKSKDRRDGRDGRDKNDGNRRDVLKDSEDARLCCHVHVPERPIVSPEELSQLLRVCGKGDYGKKELDSLHAALCCNPLCPAAVAASREKIVPPVAVSPESTIKKSPTSPNVKKGDFVCTKSDCPYFPRDSAKHKGDRGEEKAQHSKDETEKRKNRTDEGTPKLDKPDKGKSPKKGNICCNPNCPGLKVDRVDKASKQREEKEKSKLPNRGDLCCNPECPGARKEKENITKKQSDDKRIASVPVKNDLCCNPKCPDAAKARTGNRHNEREERHQSKEKSTRSENISPCCNPTCPDRSRKENKEHWNRQVQRA